MYLTLALCALGGVIFCIVGMLTEDSLTKDLEKKNEQK